MKLTIRVLACLALAAISGVARAETITLVPALDNTIYETAHNLSNGVGEFVFVGNNAVWQPRRALLAFSLEGIPSGSQITSVQLELQLEKSARTTDDEISLHRLTQIWGEALSDAGEGGIGNGEGDGIVADTGDATWSHAFYPTEEWTALGGAFEQAASASAVVGSEPASCVWGSTSQMVADVQGWLDAPETNAGWILIGNEAPNRTARVFCSKDHSDDARRPRLKVEFSPSTPLDEQSVSGLKANYAPRDP